MSDNRLAALEIKVDRVLDIIANLPPQLLEMVRNEFKVLVDKTAPREKVYDVNGAAKRLGLAPWTVRKKCGDEEILAKKIGEGAGGQGEWRITDEEIERYNREGKWKKPPRGDN